MHQLDVQARAKSGDAGLHFFSVIGNFAPYVYAHAPCLTAY